MEQSQGGWEEEETHLIHIFVNTGRLLRKLIRLQTLRHISARQVDTCTDTKSKRKQIGKGEQTSKLLIECSRAIELRTNKEQI